MNERLGLTEDLQARRETLVANLSPSARHRIFPTVYARPVPLADPAAEARAEAVALRAENEELRATIIGLENERRALIRQLEGGAPPDMRKASIGDVQLAFLAAYADAGGLIEGRQYTMQDLVGPGRSRDRAWPRHICVSLVRRICGGQSLPKIGKYFGARDHTTMMHALARVDGHMQEDLLLADVHAKVLAQFEMPQ